MVNTVTKPIQDAETRRILQNLWDFLLANLAPGEKLSKEEFLDYAKVHNELNSLAQLIVDACMDRFRECMHRTLRIITPEYLHERLIDEIKVFLQSNFLQPEQYNLLRSDIENAKVEMAEMNIEYDEQTLARYTLLRNLVIKEKGSFQLEKHKGICYVYNKREDLTQKAMKDFVRFAYMLKLINEKLTELENNRVEEVVSKKPEETVSTLIHPAIKDNQIPEIHGELKRLAQTQRIPEICLYLQQMKKDGKILLPQNPSLVFTELTRLGMPNGDGFTENNFRKYYN